MEFNALIASQASDKSEFDYIIKQVQKTMKIGKHRFVRLPKLISSEITEMLQEKGFQIEQEFDGGGGIPIATLIIWQ